MGAFRDVIDIEIQANGKKENEGEYREGDFEGELVRV